MERIEIEGANVSEIHDGDSTIVVSVPQHLKGSQRQKLREIAERAFPGRRLMIVDGGIEVSDAGRSAQMDRIEAKLDALLDALADEGDDDEPQYDLDGNLIEGGERDENESLD